MTGILMLENMNRGNTLKQGDLSMLKYRLYDADSDNLAISGKSATVRLMKKGFTFIAYEKEGLVVSSDNTIAFNINKVIPGGTYYLDIIVDDQYVFPSRHEEGKFNVDRSSLGAELNIIENLGIDAVVRKAVDLITEDPSLIIDEDKLISSIIANTPVGSIEEYYQEYRDAIKEYADLKPKALSAITKSDDALTRSQNALSVANGIDAKATNALNLSKSADALSKSVQDQFNQVIIDGDSSVEAAQARVDADGETNATLKARLDKEHNEVTAQLAQTDREKISRGNVSVSDINKNLGKFDQTYMTDEFLQQMSGNAPINATPTSFSITQDKLAEKTVTTRKTDFIKHSSNLFNKNDIVENARIGAQTGELDLSTTAYSVSGFISVLPNTVYTGNNFYRKAFYNKNRTFIISDVVDGTFTTPSDAFYVRLQFAKGLEFTTQLNLGNILLQYEQFNIQLDESIGVVLKDNSIESKHVQNGIIDEKKTTFIHVSTNLFDKTTAVLGKLISVNGSITDKEDYAYSDFIEVEPNTEYIMTPTQSVACYDKDRNFVMRETGVTVDMPYLLTTGMTTRFIRINLNLKSSFVNLNTAQINKGSELLPYEDFGFELSDKIKVKGTVGGGGNGDSGTGENIAQKDAYVINGKLDGYYEQINPLPARTYMPHDVIYSFYDDLVSEYPEYVSKSQIGSSVNGLPIYRYDFKRSDVQAPETKTPKMLIVSGTHGPEKMSVDVLKHTMSEITKNWKEDELLETLRWNVDFIIIPILNPDGWDAHSRENANGVDLNRNFEAGWYELDPTTQKRGTHPYSEPEAQALKAVMDNENDLIYICDFHNFSTRTQEDNLHELIWIVGETTFQLNLAKTLIRTVSQKWKRKHTFLPQDDTTYFGYASTYVGGTIARYGVSLGVQSSLYECSQAIKGYNPEDGNYGPIAMGMFTEAYVNWLILNLRNNIRL